MKKSFGVIGGDRRQVELAHLLCADGCAVRSWGLCQEGPGAAELNEVLSAEVVVLPLPLCWQEGVLNVQGETISTRSLFERMHPGQLALAGQVKPMQAREAAAAGVILLDYFQREELTVANAIPTAEGAIQIAMENLPRTLYGTCTLVLGYGRIGKLLAHRLCGLGAEVTVAARKWADRTWAEAMGCQTLRTEQLSGNLARFQLVINTVPALLLEEPLLRQLPRDSLVIDVASVPGLDASAAEKLGVQTIWARGLPGKLSPVSAAEAIRDAVYHIIEERSEI